MTDSNGLTVTSNTLSYTVDTDPAVSSSSFAASAGSFLEGSSTTLTTTVTGGKAPFTYSYLGLPPGCSSANVPSLSCAPSATGTFTVEVVIHSANGFEVTQNTTFTVNPEVLGLPAVEGYALIGALAVLAAVVVVVAITLSRRRKKRGQTAIALPQEQTPSPPATSPGGGDRSGQPPPPPTAAQGPAMPAVSPPRPGPFGSSSPPYEPRGGSVGALPAPAPPGSRFCPYCGQANQGEFAFCQKCGKPIPPIS